MPLKNLDRLVTRLRAMPPQVQDAVRKEMEKTAKSIVQMMKSIAPVLSEPDSRRRAGALRDSIDWTWGQAPSGSVSMGTVRDGEGLVITIFAGRRGGKDDAFYASWVEFGTKKMAAQPYFFPSIRVHRRGFTARINRAAVTAMRKVWG